MRLIVLNIGNTRARGARWENGRFTRHAAAPSGAAAAERAALLARLARGPAVDEVRLASVCPARTSGWRRAAAVRSGAGRIREITTATPLGLNMNYPRPDTLGVDRWLNVAEAAAEWGTPVIAVDVGTATTLDAADRTGFVGGLIVPGPTLMLAALADRTARLPRLDFRPAPGALGRNTRDALRIGVWEGYLGLLRRLIAGLRRRPGLRRARVIFTGGAGAAPAAALGFPYDADLTLRAMTRPPILSVS